MPGWYGDERLNKGAAYPQDKIINASTFPSIAARRRQLEKKGWYLRDHSKLKIKIPLDGEKAEPWNGVIDTCLYRENGEVLAAVEAERT